MKNLDCGQDDSYPDDLLEASRAAEPAPKPTNCSHGLICWATDGYLCLLCHKIVTTTEAASLIQREHSVVTLIHIHSDEV